MTAVRCRDLHKVYGSGEGTYAALRGLSLEVRSGEFLAVTGPSGCGKSTLLHLFGLLDKPSSGELHLLGRSVEHLSDRERTKLRRRHIGFVFQSFQLLPRHTALENVCLPMAYAGLPRVEREMRALELLTRVGLGPKVLAAPLHLSGGERQRVAIARALANGPELLLADEPTGNLDSKSSAEVIGLFGELHREGMTVILVTHDPQVAAAARRRVRVKDGAIEEGGHGV